MRVRALLAAGLAAGLASEPPVFAMPAGVAPPSLALTCRVYAKAVGILIASLLDSHAIFWPGERLWPASSVALVWDAESEDDRRAAAALSLRFPRVRHLWEAAPPDGTLCGKMRGLGYDRQQWSNFVQVRENVLLPSFLSENVPSHSGATSCRIGSSPAEQATRSCPAGLLASCSTGSHSFSASVRHRSGFSRCFGA